MPLTDTECRNTKQGAKPQKLSDEHGLYLLIPSEGKGKGRYWRWDFRHGGKRYTMAFGVYPTVTLQAARKRRDAARVVLSEGHNPMVEKVKKRRAEAEAAENSFESVALDWHKANLVRWAAVTGAKTLKLIKGDLFPDLGPRPIATITAPEILTVLRKVEKRGAAYTATRLRELCGQVFRYGIATGKCSHNPAADLVQAIVVPGVKHRPAITDRREFGAFLRALRDYKAADHMTLLGTRLAMLTFLRSQEFRHAQWDEIDFENKEWRIPAARMKMGKGSNQAHIVPLSAASVETLAKLRVLTGSGPNMFPNSFGADGHMSENTIGRMLHRMGYKDRQTLHGFRASARSLLSERGWSVAALERQLDHAERSKVVAAYARSEHLEERRKIMDDWSNVVTALEAGDNVVPLAKKAA